MIVTIDIIVRMLIMICTDEYQSSSYAYNGFPSYVMWVKKLILANLQQFVHARLVYARSISLLSGVWLRLVFRGCCEHSTPQRAEVAHLNSAMPS